MFILYFSGLCSPVNTGCWFEVGLLCVWVFCLHMSVPCACNVWGPEHWNYGWLWAVLWVLGLEPGSSDRVQLLTAEPSSQSHCWIFVGTGSHYVSQTSLELSSLPRPLSVLMLDWNVVMCLSDNVYVCCILWYGAAISFGKVIHTLLCLKPMILTAYFTCGMINCHL